MNNAADENEVNHHEKKERDEAKRYKDSLINVMSTEPGRSFMWEMLSKAGLFRTSFTGNSATFFNEGKRSLGLELMADIQEFCPRHYVTMHDEATKRQFDKKE